MKQLSLVILLCLFICTINFAQLVTAPLGSRSINPGPKETSSFLNLSNRADTDTLELPFIEDFSDGPQKPNPVKWLDADVLINSDYPIKPPSIGVATFDGLDGYGKPYAASISQGSADTLTSSPINLRYQSGDSIYLSFFYQPKGLGNFPEYVDTFQLEFKNPNDTVWRYAWSSKGEDFPQSYQDFKQVMIPIRDTAYLKKGFQFRFRNYAQLNGSYDHWHLDYIRLDKNRSKNDTLFNDVGFMYRSRSLLKEYQSVPYKHFLPLANDNMDETYNLTFFNQTANVTNRFYGYKFLYEDNSSVADFLEMEAHGPLIPRGQYLLTDPVKYTYEDRGTDWTVYYLKHFLDANTDNNALNDTSVYTQILSNYYALDDDTPEDRIYLNNDQTGFVSQRFETYLGDTLKAIQFYFNRVNDGVIDKPFTLMVWNAGSNVPGELVLSQEVLYPAANADYNKFYTYTLDVPVYLPAGTYYVGWAQAVPFEINLGFDRNMLNNDRIFYNLSGNWYNYSAESGTLMIRPLFREPFDIYVGTSEPNTQGSGWNVFPNPANGYTGFHTAGDNSNSTISLSDLSGRILQTYFLQGSELEIETSALVNGVYIVTETNSKTNYRTSKLLVVQH
jgi:hypothetical protein